MTIAEAREKCKSIKGRIPKDILLVAILILSALASFGLGFLAGRDAALLAASATEQGSQRFSTTGQIIASKNGTKYYLPSCSGAARISDANKVFFVSPESAEAAGYSRASNCNEP